MASKTHRRHTLALVAATLATGAFLFAGCGSDNTPRAGGDAGPGGGSDAGNVPHDSGSVPPGTDGGPGGTICSDTCTYAMDTECDDGAAGSTTTACEFGTDCTDCGPRNPGDCTPSCTGATCGSDGCGGSCGTCAAGESCTGGA